MLCYPALSAPRRTLHLNSLTGRQFLQKMKV
ncbi:hypothetical protein FQN60_016777 [Etheostoma spectabile]|uniref:Uncharacterized protein n=1 Tax=Etheostoma spectabile TaxID=54343 RepID=A0A5J5C6L9_9PERO|nr:hypothetical protein FQN60_016777 [Etheostoma spectabile]